MRNLINAFVILSLENTITKLITLQILRFKVVSVPEQVGLSMTWSESPKTNFLMTVQKLGACSLIFFCAANGLQMMEPVTV